MTDPFDATRVTALEAELRFPIRSAYTPGGATIIYAKLAAFKEGAEWQAEQNAAALAAVRTENERLRGERYRLAAAMSAAERERDEARVALTEANRKIEAALAKSREGDNRMADVQRILAATPKPVVKCPHWSPGKITVRKGCTACAAESAPTPKPVQENTEPPTPNGNER